MPAPATFVADQAGPGPTVKAPKSFIADGGPPQGAPPPINFDEIINPVAPSAADDNLQRAAQNFYDEQSVASRLHAIAPVKQSELKEWHPSLWDKVRNSDIGHKLFGPTDVERQGMEEGALAGSPGGNVGLVPIALSTPGPWLPANETMAGKALLSYFVASNVAQQPERIGEISELLDKGDKQSKKAAYGKILEDVLQTGMAAGAAHGLVEGITAKTPGAPSEAPKSFQPSEPQPQTAKLDSTPPSPSPAAPAAAVASQPEAGRTTAPAQAPVDLSDLETTIMGNQIKMPAGAKPAPKMQIQGGDIEKGINQFLAENNLPVNAWDNDQRLGIHNMIRAAFENVAVDQQLHPAIIKAGLGLEPFVGHLKRNGFLPLDWQPQVRDGFGSGLRLPTDEEIAQKQKDLFGKIDVNKARDFIADDANKKSSEEIKAQMLRKIKAGLPVPADHVVNFKDARIDAMLSDQGFERSADGNWFVKIPIIIPPQQQQDKKKDSGSLPKAATSVPEPAAKPVETSKPAETAKTPRAPSEPEKIKSAAIRSADGTIYTGQWHPAAYEKYMADKGVSKSQAISEQQSGKITDGFLTSTGRFVDRDEAATIASKASQFKPDKEGDVAFAGALKGLDRESKIIKPGRIEGMGSSSPARAAAVASAKATRTQQQNVPAAMAAMQQLQSATAGVLAAPSPRPSPPGGRGSGPKYFTTLRANFNPMSLGESAKQTATVLRYMLGKRYQAEQRFDEVMAKFRNAFDKQTTPRNYRYDTSPRPSPQGGEGVLPPNWELQRAIDSGDMANLTPLETQFATEARKLLDAAITRVQSLKPDVLQQLHEFYFPRNWVDADGNDGSAAALRLSQSHRPFAGAKSFLKQRSLALWDDALKLGLKPRFDNPADALRSKLGEMEQFASALEAHNELKAQGVKRFRYIFEKMPDGWSNQVDDPGTKVFAPPVVTIKEAFDEQIRTKTREMFQSLGIDEKRLESIGGKRWGYASESPEKVVTKFGGPDFVFWHEFGHIMDFRFPDLRDTLGLKVGGKFSSVTDKELQALADARGLGTKGYPRKAEEKMANVFDAYVRAPELFRQTAPTVFNNLLRWLELHPEVKGPLNDIRPSLRLGQGETEKFVGGPILLGEWIMPEPAARVMNNYLAPGVWAKAKGLSGIKKLGGMISNVRLISLFHGQMVGNDALASGLSLPLYDAMKAVADRDPGLLKRAATDLIKAPARPFLALAQGSRMLKAIRQGDAVKGVPTLDQQLAQYAIEANLRAGHMNIVDNASRRWKQSLFEAGNAIKSGTRWNASLPRGTGAIPPALDLFLQTPLALGHEMMRPVMEWFVPRMKYGLAAPMLQRIIADNPNADEWELRRQFGKAADSVEDRVGQVTYDNLFMSRAVKDSGQLSLQAFGWHLTKERMLWGAASDYFKAGNAMLTGRKPDISFRMAYLPSLVLTHAIIGGTIMYALTGRRPSKLVDYLFPETGLVDAYGKPVRVAIADFLKDYVGEWNAAMHGPHAVVDEWTRRLMPVWNELADMYRNKDFWNTQIFSERTFDETEYQHLWKNLGEAVSYMAGSTAPFSVKGAQRFSQSLGPDSTGLQTMLAHFGPFFGFVPAPQALTQSPAEAKAAEIMRDSLPPMSKDQSAHVQAISQLVHDLRTGKINDAGTFEGRARAANVKDKAELTRIQERVLWTPLQYQLHKLPLYQPGTGRDAMTVWDLMSDKEKVSTAPVFAEKIQRAYDGGKLDVPTTSRLVRLVIPYLKQAKAEQTAKTPSSPSGLRSFQE